jgi:hypothetical protein
MHTDQNKMQTGKRQEGYVNFQDVGAEPKDPPPKTSAEELRKRKILDYIKTGRY